MKFHVKSCLVFLLITLILLLGVTAINAVNVDNGNQTNIEQTKVSTTSYVDIASDVEETTSNLKTNEKNENYDKVITTQIDTKNTDTTHSKNIKQTPSGNSQPGYIYVRPHYVGTINNPPAGGVKSNERINAAGTINDPTDIYTAFSRVRDNPSRYSVIYMMADDNKAETVYESEDYAVYIEPSKPITITVIGEPGKTIVWSGKNWTSNMLSISDRSDVTVQNILFRDGNASGIPRGSQSWQKTADVGGAIDNRGTLHAINCTFERILANQYGGAIANYDNADATIEGCTFKYINSTNDTNIQAEANLAYGGAISATNTNGHSPQITVKNSNFTNVTGENGAVILNNGGSFNIENVNIVNATATVEGGAIINRDGDITIKNMNVSNVSSRRYGGVIANHGTADIDGLNVHNSTIVYDNDIDYDDDQYGGTIYNEGELTIKNSQLDNLTSAWGGVFSNNGGTLEADNVTAYDVYASYNGGVLINYNYGETTITNSNFSNINATFEPPQGNGAGIYLVEGTVNFNNNNLSDCNSRGSAIAYNFFGELNLEGNNFTNNHVDGEDNYLIMAPMEEYGFATTTVDNNNFINNTNVYYGEDNDALFYNQFASATGNTYINNTLSYNITLIPQGGSDRLIDTGIKYHPEVNVTLNGTDNETAISFNIRSVYLTSGDDKYIDGSIQVFLNDVFFTKYPLNVLESNSLIMIPVTELEKYDNNMTFKFISKDKDFLDSEVTFKVFKVLSTNVTVDNVEEKIPIGDSFTVEGFLYALEGKYAGVIKGINDKPGLKADPVEITQVPISGATVTIDVEDDTHGPYTAITNEDGIYSATINGENTIQSAGIKKITVTYDGIYDHYNADDDIGEVEIIKRNVTVILDDISDVNVRDTAYISGSVVDTEDSSRIVSSGKVTITITDENGTQLKQVEVPVESDGTYHYDYPTDTTIINTVTVEYADENGIYDQQPKDPKVNKSFNVNQLESIITIDVNPTQVYIGDEIVITGTLTKADGTTPIGDVDITLDIGINNEQMTVHVESDGTFTTDPVLINSTTDYNITAVYDGNNTYLGDNDKADIEVKIRPIPTVLTMTSENVSINETNEINLVVTDNDGNPINGTVMLSVDGIFEEVTITDGVGLYKYKDTEIGKNVTISGYFVEDTTKGYLRSPTAQTEFEVLKLGTDITITNSDDVIAHKEATAYITLTHEGQPVIGEIVNIEIKDAAGNILATGIEAETDANGQVEVNFTPVSVAAITINATHPENNVYNRSENLHQVSPILSIETTTTVTTTDTTINGSSVITVVVTDKEGNPVKGQVQLTINGQEVAQTIETDENGMATYECGPTDAYAPTTEYEVVTVSAKFIENETNGYKESESQSTIFTVDRLNTTIDIQTESGVKAHKQTSTTITLSNSTTHLAAGEPVQVTVIQEGITLNSTTLTTDENGQVKLDFIPVSTEDIEITVNYAENNVYNANSESETITNIKAMKTTLEITSENVNINETSKVKITVTDELDQPVTGTVLLIVDGQFVEVDVIDGEAVYNYTNTQEGKNVTISGYFKEDEDNGYKQSKTDSTTFEVEKIGIEIEVTVNPESPITAHETTTATITLTNTTIVDDEEVTKNIKDEEVTVIIKDAEGNVLANVTAKTDEAGQITVDFTPEIDSDITITVEHPENDAYAPASKEEPVEVEPMGVAVEITPIENTPINGTTPIEVVVTDDEGNPIVGVNVTLTIDDGLDEPIEVVLTTDEEGKITYPYNDTEVGKTVSVTAKVTDDGYNQEEPATDEFTVDKLDTTITIVPATDVTAHKPTSANITLTTEEGIIPEGEEVTITVTQGDDVIATIVGTIGPDGQVTIDFTPENNQPITISVEYEGSEVYNGDNDDKEIPVNNMGTNVVITPVDDTIIGGTTPIEVVVTDDEGNPVSGAEVELTFVDDSGEEPIITTKKVTTGEDGKVTYPYTDTQVGKNVTVTAKVLADEENAYLESEPSQPDTFEVAKLDTTIVIEPESSVTAHKETSATITVTSGTEPLPEGTEVKVTITQNGIPLKDTTVAIDENGQVTVDYTPVNTDDVVIAVEYDGNNVYNPSEGSVTVGNIRPIDTVMTITTDDVSINETAIIKVEVVDAEGNPVTGTAIITVDGQFVEVSVTDGVGEYPYINTQIGKNVTVTGYFADNVTNGYIRSPVTSDDFEVEKLPIDVTLEVSPDLTAHVPATATITLTNDTAKEVVVPGEEVTVVITDEDGNVLANVTATTDDAGQVIVDFTPLTEGKITIDLLHPENDVYIEVSAMAENTVDAMEINVVITPVDNTEINGTTDVVVVVTDDEGNPVSGVNVTLTFTDEDGNIQEVNVTTGEDGKATYVYDDTEEGKTVTVVAEVTDDGFNPISEEPATSEFDVTKLTPEINIVSEDEVTAHKPTSANITIATEDGIIPVGETVTVTVTQDGVDEPLLTQEVTIGPDGTFTIDFMPENTEGINIQVIFDETEQFNSNEANAPIETINSIGTNVVIAPVEDTIIGGTTPVEVVVTDDEGNTVPSITVKITYTDDEGNSETITLTTDENGKISDEYTNTLKGKNVTVTATVVADDERGYKSSVSEPETFEVAKLNTTVAIDPEGSVTAHKPTSATVTLSSDSVPAGEDVLVTVIQNGVKLNETTVKTDDGGKLVVDFIPVNTDDIVITAVYDGSEVYNGNDATTTIGNIRSIATVLNITSENVSINGTSNIRLNVTDEEGNPVNGTVILTVDGQLVEVDVVDGSAVYEYNDTTVGKNVTVTGYFVEDAANGYLKSKVNSTTFEVEKLDLNIDVEVPEDVTAHKETSTTITLTNETGDNVAGEEVNVVITDEDGNVLANVTATTDENGQVIVGFTPITDKDVTINVVHPESDAYIQKTGSETIGDVSVMGTYVDLSAENTTINGTSIITVVVTDNNDDSVGGINVTLRFEVEGQEPLSVNVTTNEDGVATYEYVDTLVGKNVTVTAVSQKDWDHGYGDSSIEQSIFEVAKLNTTIEIMPEDAIVQKPTNATITISNQTSALAAGENVKIVVTQGDNTLNETTLVTDENGQVIVGYTPETTQSIKISVVYDETPVYNANNADITVDVNKLNTTIAIEPDSPVTAHKETSATITVISDVGPLPSGQEVTVTIMQNDKELNITTATIGENGQITVDYTPVNTDDVVIAVEYDGNDVYNPSEDSVTVGNIRPIDTVMTITTDDVSINETAIIKVEVVDAEGNPVTGTAIITVDGQFVEVSVTDGVGEYPYINTQIGKNVTVTGYFADNVTNGYVRSPVTSDDFEVEKLPIDIALEVSPDLTAHVPATATVTLTNDTAKEVVVSGEEVTVVITDEDGNVLANVTATTDDAGQVIVDFTPVNTSPITISVEHPENDVYNKASSEVTIDDVGAMGTNVEITQAQDTIINGTSTVGIVVTDELGNPVVGGTVELTFDDGSDEPVVVTVVTDEDGVAAYVYDDTEVGKTVSVSAKLLEDVEDGYSESEPVEDAFDVLKLDVIIDIVPEEGIKAHVTTNATVIVSTEDGVVPAGEVVNVVVSQGDIELFNGEVTLDENGQVVVPFTPENTDDIEIMVIFDETDQFNDNENSVVIDDVAAMGIVMNVTADNTTINGTSTITVTLTDEEGNPISGVVELTVPGVDEPVVVNVDETGIATITYDDTEVGKNVTITAELTEPTEGYAPVDPVDVTLEVAKLNPTITIMPETPVTAHKPNSATINVSTEEGTIPEGETVSIVVTQNGESIATIDGVVSEDGTIVIEYVPETTDDVTISVVFDETPVYNAADNQTTIGNIKSIATVLNITSENVSINGTSNIRLNVTDEEGNPVNGTVILTVDGQLVEVDVVDGSAVYEYNDTTVGKNVTVTGYFVEDAANGYLKSKVNSTTFEVEKLDLDIDVEVPEDVTAHKETSTTITLTNETGDNVAGEEVNVVITDEEGNVLANVTATTDENGQVTVDFTPITNKPITISVEHPENDVYGTATKEESIKDIDNICTTIDLTTENTTINGTSTVTVIVTDDEGNPVVGDVELTIGDEIVTVTTDENGMATYNYTNTTEGKNVTVSAKLATDPEDGYELTEYDDQTFEVAKLNTTIVIVPEDGIKAHEPASANITISNATGTLPAGEEVQVVVTQGDKELANETLITDENGQVTIPFTPENTDDITISVVYDETPVYNANSKDTTIDDVAAMGIVMNVTADNTTINGTSTITVTLTDEEGNPISGVVELTVPGVDEPVVVEVGEDGVGTYTYNDTTEGKNVTITAQLTEPTEGYAPVYPVEVTIEIAKQNTTITIKPEDNVKAHKPTSATITVSNETSTLPTGESVKVVVTQDGKELANDVLTTDENGQVVIPFTPLNTEHIDIEAVYDETPVYVGANNTTEIINVKPMQTYINLTSEDVIINGTSHINITVIDELANPVNGTVLLIVDGDFVEVNITDGNGLYEYTNTTVGKNVTVTGYYVENTTNAYLKSEYNSTAFEVAKLNTTVTAQVANSTITNFTIDVKVDGVDTDAVVESGKVEVYVDDVKVGEAEVTGGVAKGIKLDINEVGNYTLTVKYDGNEVFNANQTTVKDVAATAINTTVTAKVTNDTAGNVTIETEVLDANGNKVPEGIVNITITKEDGTTETIGQAPVKDGVATITTNINKTGNYNITVIYEGTDKYAPSNSSKVPVEVEPRDTNLTANVANDTLGNTTVNVTVTDPTTGKPIANEPVIVTLPNGTNITAKTDKNGTVVVPVDLPVGKQNITVIYPGDDTNSPINISIPVEVQPRQSKTTAKVTNRTAGNVTVQATVTDAKTNKPVTEGPVDIIATDKYGNEKIIGTGVLNGTNVVPITVDIDQIGEYNLTAKYKGNENYTESKSKPVTTEVVGRKTDMQVAVANDTVGNTTVNVTVTDPTTGKPIANQPVIVTLPNGTNIPSQTDNNGNAVIPVDVPAGKTKLNVTYPGDNTNKPITKQVTINAQKINVTITIQPINPVKINKTYLINATVKDAYGNLVTEGDVQLFVNGTSIGKVTLTNGTIYKEYSNKQNGVYPVEARYLGSPKYNKDTDNTTVEIIKLETKIELKDMTAVIGDTIEFVAKVTDENNNVVNNGQLAIKLNGVTVTDSNNKPVFATVENGIAKVKFTVPLNWRGQSYNITAVYSGTNRVYEASRGGPNKLTMNYRTADIKLTVSPTTSCMDKVVKFTANVYDKDTKAKLKNGVVIFKLNGQTLKDANGKSVQVNVVNGVAIYNYTVPDGMKARDYNITAVYAYKDFYRAEDSANLTITTVKTHFNVTEEIKNKVLTIKGKLLDPSNHTTLGENTACVKLNGETIKKADGNTQYFSINNGIVDIKVNIPSKYYNKTVTSIEIVTGGRYAYDSCRLTTKTNVKV